MSIHKTAPEVQDVPDHLAFDVAGLERFLASSLGGSPGPITVSKFTGGQSNPTYRLDMEQRTLVLRRKPPGKILTSAHAVDREARVMRGLGRVGFPVPGVLAECDDSGVIGTPFYVMEYLNGRIFWDPLLPVLSPDERRDVYFALTDVLAALHTVDVDAAGLSDLGARGNYYTRQIERWTAQYRAAPDDPVPEMETLARWLADNLPSDNQISVVHGDFRLDNAVFHGERQEILGVIDWELATIGNAMADLSYFLLNWIVPLNFSGSPSLANSDLVALGIPSADDIIDRYFDSTQTERPENFAFHHAYNLFRIAAILHGIAARSRIGNASSKQADRMGARVRPAALLACSMVGID